MTNQDDSALSTYEGLTKREYFATAAMQGLLASYAGNGLPSADKISEQASNYADALIKKLNDNGTESN